MSDPAKKRFWSSVMKQCTKCGAIFDDGVRFCSSCGTMLPADPAAAAPVNTAPTYPEPTNPAPVNTPPTGASAPGYNAPNYSYAQNTAAAPQQPQQSGLFGDYVPQKVTTKRDFLRLEENRGLYNTCKVAAIICYVCAGINLAMLIFLGGSAASLLDIALLIGLGVGIHVAQSRACAIVLLVYSIINMIIMIAVAGTFGGYLVLFAGIWAVSATVKAASAWKAYQENPLPQQMYPQPSWMQNAAPAESAQPQREAQSNEWKCPTCGRVNQNYVGTCGCGTEKPH